MMMKKTYSTPQVDMVMLAQQQPLLIGSYDGPANAPEVDFGFDEENIFSSDKTIFSDDTTLDVSL
jgi:hypothetical protein